MSAMPRPGRAGAVMVGLIEILPILLVVLIIACLPLLSDEPPAR